MQLAFLAGIEDATTSLVEMLPDVQSLSRQDNIRLIRFLAQDLEQDEATLIEPGQSYPIWSPDRAFAAAETLLQALEDKNALNHRD